jgi:uncharacterized protein (TIGR03083 family)
MESSRLLECLAIDHGRLREVAARDLTATVPSCPGWTVTALVQHVAEVYLHKTEAMRRGTWPGDDGWPPPDLVEEEPIALLERAYAALLAEFVTRTPESAALTWHRPDQTVGFWIRRMAQETVIHRIDAELALGAEVQPIPADLAVDGIDEVLTLFLVYGVEAWPDEFRDQIKGLTPFTVDVVTDGGTWQVTGSPAGLALTDGADGADAVLSGPAPALLRHLWGRGGDDEVVVAGSPEAVASLRALLVTGTQ